jgi:cyclase
VSTAIVLFAHGSRDPHWHRPIQAVAEAVPVPVIASGGAGCIDHIAAALEQGQASAALLASLLHDGVLTVEAIKRDLLARGLALRPLVGEPVPAGPFGDDRAAA